MSKLYACLGSGNCFKPWLALHQTQQPFELFLIDVLSGEQKSEAYLELNPLGVVPYFETNSSRGIGESNAMLWYLSENTHLMPEHPSDRAEALQWMFFEQSKLEPNISPARFFTTILPHEAQAKAEEIKGWQDAAALGLARLDTHLEGRTFVIQSGYSVADIALFGYAHVMDEAGIAMGNYPNIARWITSVSQTEDFRPLAELGQARSVAA